MIRERDRINAHRSYVGRLGYKTLVSGVEAGSLNRTVMPGFIPPRSKRLPRLRAGIQTGGHAHLRIKSLCETSTAWVHRRMEAQEKRVGVNTTNCFVCSWAVLKVMGVNHPQGLCSKAWTPVTTIYAVMFDEPATTLCLLPWPLDFECKQKTGFRSSSCVERSVETLALGEDYLIVETCPRPAWPKCGIPSAFLMQQQWQRSPSFWWEPARVVDILGQN